MLDRRVEALVLNAIAMLRRLSTEELKAVRSYADIAKFVNRRPSWRKGIFYQIFSDRGIIRGLVRDSHRFWDEDSLLKKWYYTIRYPLYRDLRKLIKSNDKWGSATTLWVSELGLILVVDTSTSHWIPCGVDCYQIEINEAASTLSSRPLKWTDLGPLINSHRTLLLTSPEPVTRELAKLFTKYSDV